MRNLTFIVLLILIGVDDFNSLAQAPSIDWQKCLGGSSQDFARSVQQTPDGGFIVAGYSQSDDMDVTGHHGTDDKYDFWIVKTDYRGAIEWQKSVGVTNDDFIYSAALCSDGGYIAAGSHATSNGIAIWIVKLNNIGDVEWEKTFGGYRANSIQQTADGGYIFVGRTSNASSNIRVSKLDTIGEIQWTKSLGGSLSDYGNCIRQTLDGGYIIAGQTMSSDGDVTVHYGDWDCWVVKLNSSGDTLWQKSFGGLEADMANSIYETSDSGYIVAGYSSSNDGDFADNHGSSDGWIAKLTNTGDVEWQKSLGGISGDYFNSVIPTSDDGGYIVAGYSQSNDGDVSGHHGNIGTSDYWVVKLDSGGSIHWQKSLGGNDNEVANSIQLTLDGWYIIAGHTSSNNSGDITGYHGSPDYWVVKLGGTTDIEETLENVLTIYPNPVNNILTIETENGKGIYQLQDITGKLLLSGTITAKRFSLDISALSKGIYLLSLIDGEQQVNRKIVKE